MPAAQRLVVWLSNILGGDLGEDQDVEPLLEQQITTASLQALRYYSEATRIYQSADPDSDQKAEVLLRKALKEDPDFASAHLLLGWALKNQDRPWSDSFAHIEDASRFSESCSEAERYFILGCLHHWKGGFAEKKPGWREDYVKASAAYEMVLDLQPNHRWADRNLRSVSFDLGTMDLRADLDRMTRRMQERPNYLHGQVSVASAQLQYGNDRPTAEPFVRRARKLLSNYPELVRTDRGVPWLRVYDCYEKWLDGDIEGTLTEADRLHQWILENPTVETQAPRHAVFLGYVYLTLGRFDQVREILGFLNGSLQMREGRNTEYLIELLKTQLAYYSGDLSGYSLQLESGHHSAWRAVLPMMLLKMDPVQGEQAAKRLVDDMTEAHRELVHCQLLLARGHTAEAIPRLTKGMDLVQETFPWPAPELFWANLAKARAELELGEVREAIAVLEEASKRKVTTFVESGALWLEVQTLLSELYTEQGREEEAVKLREGILHHLSYADPNHKLIIRLQQTDS